MLVAYLDEFGHIGPYISPDHRKFFHHPVFGYAGFVIRADRARDFEGSFEHRKERQFRADIVASGSHPRRWERKGSEMFTTGSFTRYPENMEMVGQLVARLRQLGGRAFFYGQVKPVGTIKQTDEQPRERNGWVLQQSIKRLAAYAASQGQSLMVFVDRTDAGVRESAIDAMAKAIYSWDTPGMRQVVQVPTELESHRYGNIQFADWIAAAVTRTSHFHLAEGSEFGWAPEQLRRLFTGAWLSETRIWDRDLQRAVSPRALEASRPWIHVPAERRRRRDLSADELTQKVGADNPALARLRHQMERERNGTA